MFHLVVKRWSAEIFDIFSIFFSMYRIIFNNVHYAALLHSNVKKRYDLHSDKFCLSELWRIVIWNYVLQIYGLTRDLCNKVCKIIMCLKLSLFRVLLFGDFCVYFPRGVNLLHIFLNKSSCSANVPFQKYFNSIS